jgi:L-cystine transport system substrate-binding protein
MKTRKLFAVVFSILLIGSLLAGCGSSASGSSPPPAAASSASTAESSGTEPSASAAPSAAAGASAPASGPAATVQVAVANDFNPYAYLDEKGNYIGYEIDVLKAVDDLLTQYQFNYQTVSDQFVALTSGKVDLIAHQWESNPTRRDTYLFGNEFVTAWTAYIVSKDGRTDLQTVKDLEGKTVQTFQGSNDAYFLETYNKEHNDAIKIVYSSDTDFSITINKIETGAIDAVIMPQRFVEQFDQSYNVNLSTSKDPVYNSDTFFIYRKDEPKETTLRDAVDGALKTLHDNGTLKKLSEQWLGGDYSVEAAIPKL